MKPETKARVDQALEDEDRGVMDKDDCIEMLCNALDEECAEHEATKKALRRMLDEWEVLRKAHNALVEAGLAIRAADHFGPVPEQCSCVVFAERALADKLGSGTEKQR